MRPHDTTMPDQLTDEKLAEIYDRAYWDTNAWIDDPIIEGVRAVRAALQPPVTPLAWGEEVAIPDLPEIGFVRVRLGYNHTLIIDTGDSVSLNAAGVAQLERACQRWRAAQNETSGVRKSLESATGAEKA